MNRQHALAILFAGSNAVCASYVDPLHDAAPDVPPDAAPPCGALPPASSCRALHERCPMLPSGSYPLETGTTDWNAYCEMSNDGGGWTLLLKTDGRAHTFTYDAPLWTNAQLLSPDSTDMSQTEAKFAGYSLLPFAELRVGLAPFGGSAPSWLVLHVGGASLLAVVSGGYVPTTAGRSGWLSLVPGADLQANCNREGIDAFGHLDSQVHVRLGIIANQENDCDTPDSFVGFGHYDSRTNTTCGAWCDNEWQCVHGAQVEMPRFGYVFAQ